MGQLYLGEWGSCTDDCANEESEMKLPASD